MSESTAARQSARDWLKTLISGVQTKGAAEVGPDGELLQELAQLTSERSRVVASIAEEEERRHEQAERLKRKDAERIDALTAARLSGHKEDKRRSDALLADSEAVTLRREIDDSKAVDGRLRARWEELSREIRSRDLRYREAQAIFLEDVFEKLIARYNALAPEVAEIVLQIAAVRRVMIARGAGDTNGWDGAILLPGMKAGRGIYIDPILDGGSSEFGNAADQRKAGIAQAMRAAGFIYG